MSLQKTDGCKKPYEVCTRTQLVRILNGGIQDELGAINLYSTIIESMENDPAWDGEIKKEVIENLKEIMKDEANHQGRLQMLVNLIDVPDNKEAYSNGLEGKE